MNWSKLLRLYTLIGAVSGVSLITFSSLFTATNLAIVVVAVGVIALVSAILGFVLAFVSSQEKPRTTETSQLPGWQLDRGD